MGNDNPELPYIIIFRYVYCLFINFFCLNDVFFFLKFLKNENILEEQYLLIA